MKQLADSRLWLCLNLAFSVHLQDKSEQLFSSTCWTWGDTELQWADRAVLLLHWIIKSLKYSVTDQRLCLLKSYSFVQHVLYNCITNWTIWYYFLFWDFNTREGGRRIWGPQTMTSNLLLLLPTIRYVFTTAMRLVQMTWLILCVVRAQLDWMKMDNFRKWYLIPILLCSYSVIS